MNKQGQSRGKPFQKGNSIGKETRWKKGQSGNPNGSRNAYSDLIREFSFQKVNDKERREIILQKLFQLAERGDLRAIQFIVERMEGKALDRQERVNKSEPIQVMVIQED